MSETSKSIDEKDFDNNLILNNILRGLTMLENSLDRLMRNNLYDRTQYPELYFDVKSLLINIREWISDFKMFSGTENFTYSLSMLLTELSQVIIDLFDVISSENGKKQVSKKQKEKQKKSIRLSMDNILDKISSAINSLHTF
ncbi:hypothetical protein MHK_005610, partial [Candidatus Magnetomorum sp. HK-1]